MKKQNDKILKSKNNLKITTHRYIFLPISLLLKGLIKTKTNHKTSFLQVLIVCYPSLFFYCKYTVPLGETCPSCQGLLSRGEPSLISVKIILTYPIENLALMFAKQLHWRYWLRMSFVLWLHKMIKYFHLLIQVISFPPFPFFFIKSLLLTGSYITAIIVTTIFMLFSNLYGTLIYIISLILSSLYFPLLHSSKHKQNFLKSAKKPFLSFWLPTH